MSIKFNFCLLFSLLIVGYANGQSTETLKFEPLFNGKNLNNWINVNTDKSTWSVKNKMIICSGKPIGVMRTDRQYENFILEIEWRHMEAGGNSGVFMGQVKKLGSKGLLL